MRELITLRKSDPQFSDYLLGTFARDRRALPVKTLNVNSEFELVTFEVLPLPFAHEQGFLARWAQIFKLKTFLFVAFPIFLVMAKVLLDGSEIPVPLAITTGLAVFSLFASANFRNDFLDHVRGLDRVHPQSAIRPIQKGWLTAQQALRLSHVFVILGFLLAVPALLTDPSLLIFLAVMTAFALIGLYSYRFGLKYRSWSELVVLAFMGPFLSVGFEISISGSFDLETIWMGLLSGALAVFVLHLKNMKNLMVNYKAGFRNTITSLGFEKAKVLLGAWMGGVTLLFGVYQVLYQGWMWGLILFVLVAMMAGPFLWLLPRVKSPVGSLMTDLSRLGRRWVFSVFVFWFLQILWQLSFLL